MFKHSKLIKFCTSVFLLLGMDKEKAIDTSEILIEADMMGHSTHGVRLLPLYIKDIELGKVYTDKNRKPFKVNEDGHTDVPSAIRKLKLSIEDSQQILQKLESMNQEDSLPAWWTDKVTLASNYLNKSRDDLLTGSKVD